MSGSFLELLDMSLWLIMSNVVLNVVVQSNEIENLFDKIESGLVKNPISEDYKLLIRNLLNTLFA